MYQVNSTNGDIHFPDGFVLACPYEDNDNRYQEYASWMHAGNEPELIAG
jgi:hypothetical protein